MKTPALLLALLSSALFSHAALAEDAPAKKMGDILVSPSGMTLYTFDKDMAGNGRSMCVEACAQLWPPFLAAADAGAGGDYSLIAREDGSKQWALKGKPLYLFSKDKQAGERNGDNYKEIWHVVKN